MQATLLKGLSHRVACPASDLLYCKIGWRSLAKGKRPAADSEDAKDSRIQLLMKAMEPMEVEVQPLTEEEKAAFAEKAKDYSRKKMAQHRRWQKELSDKIRLKWEAVAAMPPHLQYAALLPPKPPPLSRLIPMHTPPIPNFAELRRQAAQAKNPTGRRGAKR
eukprot:jgi/Botrbrau1/13044/Bobra.0187s0007.1